MADNYLITGYWGEPHVTVENDRGFNAAVFGTGKFVLPVGEMFRAEYIGNNTIRVYDGKLIDNGAVAGIPAGEYVEFTIPEAGQSMKRNDLIVFEYSRHESTLVESGVFKVLSGAETSETAVDPVLTENDLLSNIASFDQMALWRIPVSGSVISAPEILYNTRFAGERIANVTSTDGKAYTANLPGVAKLYNGLEIIIIPDITSTTTLPSLNINGIGAVNIKRRITSNTRTTVQSENDNFLYQDQPIRLIYNGSAWVADMARANVNDLYGTVPVEKGGTGADNAEEACENLGVITTSQKGAANGVASLNSSGLVPDNQIGYTSGDLIVSVDNNHMVFSSNRSKWYKYGRVVVFYIDVTIVVPNAAYWGSFTVSGYPRLSTAKVDGLLVGGICEIKSPGASNPGIIRAANFTAMYNGNTSITALPLVDNAIVSNAEHSIVGSLMYMVI